MAKKLSVKGRKKAQSVSGWTHHLKQYGKRVINKAERRAWKEILKKEAV